MLELTVRLVASLAIVVGLLLLLAKFGARKFRGNAGAMVHVVHRQPLSRTSAVAVVTVGSRVLVLGTTEQQVSVLAEMDPEELDLPLEALEPVAGEEVLTLPVELTAVPAPAENRVAAGAKHRAGHRAEGATVLGDGGPLAGSVLSAQTWKQAYKTVTGLGAVKPPSKPGRRAS